VHVESAAVILLVSGDPLAQTLSARGSQSRDRSVRTMASQINRGLSMNPELGRGSEAVGGDATLAGHDDVHGVDLDRNGSFKVLQN